MGRPRGACLGRRRADARSLRRRRAGLDRRRRAPAPGDGAGHRRRARSLVPARVRPDAAGGDPRKRRRPAAAARRRLGAAGRAWTTSSGSPASWACWCGSTSRARPPSPGSSRPIWMRRWPAGWTTGTPSRTPRSWPSAAAGCSAAPSTSALGGDRHTRRRRRPGVLGGGASGPRAGRRRGHGGALVRVGERGRPRHHRGRLACAQPAGLAVLAGTRVPADLPPAAPDDHDRGTPTIPPCPAPV